ncbi:MAG: hypothetical protein IJ560_01790 [Alphaproteobacteria bacterium]|nr:hypothetical protein [Alphaproteobacteria bacterium]
MRDKYNRAEYVEFSKQEKQLLREKTVHNNTIDSLCTLLKSKENKLAALKRDYRNIDINCHRINCLERVVADLRQTVMNAFGGLARQRGR